MLDVFREGAKTWVSRLLIWFVALTFVGTAFAVWGKGTSTPEDAAAVVKGESISKRRLSERTRQVESMFRKQFEGLDPSMLKSLNASAVAMNSLIDVILQSKAAQTAGVTVTDGELSDAVRSMNEFHTAGAFDGRRYIEVLKRNGMTPKGFENSVRADILVGKFKMLINSDVYVSNIEAMNQYAYEHQQVVVEYVDVNKETMKSKIGVDEEKAKAWFEDKKQTFEEPEKRDFKLVVINFSSLAEKVEPTDEEIERYYSDNSEQFAVPEKVHARQILVKVSPTASDEEIKAATAKIEKAYGRIAIVGDDFADVAKEMSEGPAAMSGGDVGTFQRGVMVAEFDKIVFGLEPGKISSPFQTEFGLHVVEAISHEQSRIPELAEVKSQVKEMVARNKASVEGRKTLEHVRDRLVAGSDLDSVVTSFAGVEVKDYFAIKGIPVISFEYPADLIDNFVFKLPAKGVSEIMDLMDASLFLVVEAIHEPRVPAYAEVKEKALEAYKSTLAFKKADEVALKIEKAVKEGGDLKTLAEANGLTMKTTKPFSRAERKKAGESARNRGMREEAFALSVGEAIASPTGAGHVVLKVLARPPLDTAKVEKEISEFKKTLIEKKKSRVYSEFLANLRKKADVDGEINIIVNLDKKI